MPRCEDAIGVLQMGPSATFILETLRPVTFHGSWLHRGANKDKKKSKDEEANAEADAVEAVMLANTLLAKKATYDMLRAGQLNMLDKAWECLDKVRCHLTAPVTTCTATSPPQSPPLLPQSPPSSPLPTTSSTTTTITTTLSHHHCCAVLTRFVAVGRLYAG